MKVDCIYRKSVNFKYLKLGDVFEYEYKLYIKIDDEDDDDEDDNGHIATAFEVLNNYKAYFKSNDLVIPRNFILKEV